MDKNKKSKMSGFDSVTGRIRRFCGDTVAELRRCSWPTRQQLLESTLLVVVSMVILACFVFGVDELARWLVKLVTVRG